MALLRRVVLVTALALLATAALVGTADRSSAQAAKAPRLAAFGSCGQLLSYAKSNASRFVGPYGLGGQNQTVIAETARGAAPPKQGVDYSGTNVQEEGVDEPDIVKTDGNTLYTVANGRLNAVDVSDPKPRLLDTLALDPAMSHELLLHGDRLLVISRGGYWIEPLPATAARFAPYQPAQAVLAEVNVADPKAAPPRPHAHARRLLRRRAARRRQRPDRRRLAGARRAAVRAAEDRDEGGPRGREPSGTAPSSPPRRSAAGCPATGSSGPARRPPARSARSSSAATCAAPPAFSGLGMLTVLTVDLTKGLEPTDSVAVMTDGRIVYASPESLYVATERWADRPDPAKPETDKNGAVTAIHKFDISSPQRTQYRGSGTVSGYLLSQWSLSEHEGVLRVVSTESPAWWGTGGETESFLTTLRPSGGSLVQAGRIGGLGKGERVYAVRFVGDTGYVVTFRQIDPLYTVDLSLPERPRVLGELKIPGYSAYLHPIGEDLLLGVGQDATEEGRPTGTQLSLFDVSDLRSPTPPPHRAASAWAGRRRSPTTTPSSTGRAPGSS